MKPDEAWKLIGGYAHGTLSGEERKALFAAALSDQKLFDALADEEALRELLADERYRREITGLLSGQRPSLLQRLAMWWWRPAPLVSAAGLAAAALALVFYVNAPPEPALEIARLETPPLTVEVPPEPPAAQPSTAPERRKSRPAAAPERESSAVSSIPSSQPAISLEADVAGEFAGAEERKQVAVSRTKDELVTLPAPSEPEVSAFRKPGASVLAGAARMAKSEGAPETQVRILRRGADGGYAVVPLSEPLALSDGVRLELGSPETGYLYVFDASLSEPSLIYSGAVVQGERYNVPAGGTLPPPEKPGQRTLRLFFSKQPVSLDALTSAGRLNEQGAQLTREVVLHYVDR